ATTVATVTTVAAVGGGVVAPDGDVNVVKVVLGVTTTILHNVRATTDREILLSPNRVLHAVLVGVIQNPVVDFRTQSDLAGVLIIVNHHVNGASLNVVVGVTTICTPATYRVNFRELAGNGLGDSVGVGVQLVFVV